MDMDTGIERDTYTFVLMRLMLSPKMLSYIYIQTFYYFYRSIYLSVQINRYATRNGYTSRGQKTTLPVALWALRGQLAEWSFVRYKSATIWGSTPGGPQVVTSAEIWPIQDIVLFLGFCARINTILCAPTLCLGTPPHPVIARTIAQYTVSPRPPSLQYKPHNIGNCNIV